MTSTRMRDYAVWAVLALPALWLVWGKLTHQAIAYVPVSGDFAGWALILCLMVTPVMLLLGPSAAVLRRHRRHLGVAAFLYALLHLVLWLRHADLPALLQSLKHLRLSTGWLGFAIMVPLALTSTDAMVRRLGTGWKRLQRWVYAAAVLSALHWVLATDHLKMAVLSMLPLVALTLWRLTRPRGAGAGRQDGLQSLEDA